MEQICPTCSRRISYRQITLPSTAQSNCWYFQGLYKIPPLHLTWIQRPLLKHASIALTILSETFKTDYVCTHYPRSQLR